MGISLFQIPEHHSVCFTMALEYNYFGVGPGVYFGSEEGTSEKGNRLYYQPKYFGPRQSQPAWMCAKDFWIPE
jgi:hypothetical protein